MTDTTARTDLGPVTRREDIPRARRIVVKVGSSSVSGDAAGQIGPLVDALAAAYGRGTEVVLVSSGAIATGFPFLGLDGRPDDLATQQAAAATGQNVLMFRYQKELDRHGVVAAQILLTAGDLQNPTHRVNAQRAIDRLLALRVLPIVNENDTVATHEIRFGDNDRLAALVARLLGADALVLLSGGAGTKVAAARLAAEAGTAVLVTDTALVDRALAGEHLGTWFHAAPRP